jgi:hypothetical protein
MAGRLLVAAGGLLALIGLFLPLYTGDFDSVNAWEALRVTDVVSLLIAVGALGAAAVSVFAAAGLLLALSLLLGTTLFGIVLTNIVEVPGASIGAGGYLGLLGAIAVAAGAVVALSPALARGLAAGGIATLDFAAFARSRARAPGEGSAEVAELPPAGWYPDPTGRAEQRFWDGSAWTEETQP